MQVSSGRAIQWLVLSAVSLPSLPVRAQGTFGDQGILVPAGLVDLSVNKAGDNDASISFTLAPELLYFLSDQLAVGGRIAVNSYPTADDRTTAFGIGARAGYNIPLGDRMSWFLSGGLTFYSGGSVTRLPIDIDAPLLFHFANFFVGIGPTVAIDAFAKMDVDLPTRVDSPNVRTVRFSITTTIGGWLTPGDAGSWSEPMPADDAAPPSRDETPAAGEGDEWS